ncbi:MAG: galactose/methyl galactoside ABC transporter permease MglC [Oscillospiraceae bacterium]|nr:galactose/methyl galactoside ABC transporter permease MglC [Oscillospiraceae bacterium]
MNEKAGAPRRPEKDKVKAFFQNNAIYIIILVIVAVIVAKEPSFLSIRVFSQILSQASTRIILALGCAGIIICGGTDLAAGRMIGMAAIITATMLQDPTYSQKIFPNFNPPIILPVLIAIAACMLFSFFHGFAVAKLKVPAFIASLGIQLIVYGCMSMYYEELNNGSPIGSLASNYKEWAQGSVKIGTSIRIPYLILYAIVAVLIVSFIWYKTKLGKNMYAIGGNIEAATVCGVNVVRSTIMVYLLAGILYGIAGALEGARTGSVTNGLGADYALDAIAACVVGGVSMRGGIGKISGVIIGVVLFQLVNYGLVYISVSPYLQYAVRGLIIITAVAIDTQRFVKKE